MNIAWFDMDGSLFDYDNHLRESLAPLASPDEPELSGDLHELENKYPYLKARMNLIKSVPGWWREMPVLEPGFAIFRLAKIIGFDCRILTKGPKSRASAWQEKVECCQMYFGNDIDINVVSSKGESYGKVLYDDFPPFMDSWLAHRPRGLGIMPVTDVNKDYKHPNVIKYDGSNYLEVKAALESAFARKVGEPLVL